jgi:hypothetical protein
MRKAKVSPDGASSRALPILILTSRGIQISVHAADVKGTLRVYSIEVAAREKDDLNEDPIVVRLRKVRVFRACLFQTAHFADFSVLPPNYYGDPLHRRVVLATTEFDPAFSSVLSIELLFVNRTLFSWFALEK